ncbi:MAG TPA: hypothetical protein VJN48_04990 [Terriglobales bacterium]|nr:hypothetical protein [Terriglobales bacterium]
MEGKTESRKRLDWLLLACANVTVPVVVIWERYEGQVGTTVMLISGLISLVIANIAVLVGIRSRKKRWGQTLSPSLVLGAALFAVVSAGIMTVGVIAVPAHNEYADLAFSNTPINQIHPEQKALLVELIRRKAANSREYAATAAQIKPFSPPLYSPESFANADVMRSTIEGLTKAADLDFAYYRKQQAAEKEFRDKVSKIDPQFLAAWDKPGGDELAEQAILRLEQQWLASTTVLYQYVGSHQKAITVQNGKLKFATTAVELEFNQRQQYSKTLYTKMEDRIQGLSRDRMQLRSRIVMPSTAPASSP